MPRRITTDDQYRADLRSLAEAIHGSTCKVAHPDQCKWYEEGKTEDPWDHRAHALFRFRAERLSELTGLYPLDIVSVLKYL